MRWPRRVTGHTNSRKDKLLAYYDQEAHVTGVALSPDGRTLASAGDDSDSNLTPKHSVRLWDVKTGRQRATLSDSLIASEVHHLAFSPDGKTLAVPSEYGLLLWNVATRKPRAILSSSAEGAAKVIQEVVFSWDGRLIAGNDSKHRRVYLWKNPYRARQGVSGGS
ncbi:WD40 repeat domain-containing protein [Streptomyces sp. Inha503]|uniref:WD40 repeat domain-containing protein n=1 Tax=Streptomyces sp. Inha503 TaxID=3383314 RepID=UPI0039A389A9